jgi:hypothetical protein
MITLNLNKYLYDYVNIYLENNNTKVTPLVRRIFKHIEGDKSRFERALELGYRAILEDRKRNDYAFVINIDVKEEFPILWEWLQEINLSVTLFTRGLFYAITRGFYTPTRG